MAARTPPRPGARSYANQGGTAATPLAITAEVRKAIDDRKIIRTGTVEYEVGNFDDAATTTVDTVRHEESGFVSATNSSRGANGKISGSVTIRVVPEHLDRVVLKLRGLGDLKGQQISAADVTKEFTDTDSKLRAARIPWKIG